jgi:hypothetical protein
LPEVDGYAKLNQNCGKKVSGAFWRQLGFGKQLGNAKGDWQLGIKKADLHR